MIKSNPKGILSAVVGVGTAPLPHSLPAPHLGFIVPLMKWAAGAGTEPKGKSQAELRAQAAQVIGSLPALCIQQRWLHGIRLCSGFHVLSV